tara:strand:+ start:1970 stop:3811 length:1842 start_codon:yes stop_codon:yes gene_type:complete
MPDYEYETEETIYNEKLVGLKGEMGRESNKVIYIQMTKKVHELEQFQTLMDIEESKKWSIKDLFQREINYGRIGTTSAPSLRKGDETSGQTLIEYFMDDKTNKKKFFAPLTIAVVPMDNREKPVNPKIDFSNDDSSTVEMKDYFKYQLVGDENLKELGFTEFKYNSQRCKLIAIDGQHRLTALKELYKIYKGSQSAYIEKLKSVNFENWVIPITLIPHVSSSQAGIISSLRDVFITINTEQKVPNRVMRILLDDFQLTKICCQTFLDDCKDKKETPLILFDWRSKKDNGNYPDNKVSFFGVGELEDWHKHYLIGERDLKKPTELSESQKTKLRYEGYTPGDDWRKKAKVKYIENIMPALHYILQNFTPIKSYIKLINQYENLSDPQKMDESNHWEIIKFKDVNKDTYDTDTLQHVYRQFEAAINRLPGMIKPNTLIGMRGILSSFDSLRNHYQTVENSNCHLKRAKWFVHHLNNIYEHNNNAYFRMKVENEALIKHVVLDQHNNIGLRYRLEKIEAGYGSLISALIISEEINNSQNHTKRTEWIREFHRNCPYMNNLEKSYKAGFKKEARPIIMNSEVPAPKINEEINKLALEMTKKQMKKLKSRLKIPALRK